MLRMTRDAISEVTKPLQGEQRDEGSSPSKDSEMGVVWMCLQKEPKPARWYMEGQVDLCDFQVRQDYIGKPYSKIIK